MFYCLTVSTLLH
ncbi:hypothetical protein F383_17272 [Gossypium arboreum]|uniref:Uncharacterized protein n=1 Tax=Gossypium arboreum TaxID=29729 RepID=A0A0B0NU39_GOSAR|nr:hypothetical protein F383_17272 [Gossypium arboreum]